MARRPSSSAQSRRPRRLPGRADQPRQGEPCDPLRFPLPPGRNLPRLDRVRPRDRLRGPTGADAPAREAGRSRDAAIKLSEAGPALSPLFDDVTALRVVRAELRKVGPALKANDMAAVRAAYEAFDKRWDDVEELIKLRSMTAYREIEDAMKKGGS